MKFRTIDKNDTEWNQRIETERKAWEQSSLFHFVDGLGLWFESLTLKSYVAMSDGRDLGNKSFRDDYLAGVWDDAMK